MIAYVVRITKTVPDQSLESKVKVKYTKNLSTARNANSLMAGVHV